jgi:hypothetical protein
MALEMFSRIIFVLRVLPVMEQPSVLVLLDFGVPGGAGVVQQAGIDVTVGGLAARMYHYTRIGSNEYRNGNTQSEFFYEGSVAIRKGSLLRDSRANCSYYGDIGKSKIFIRRDSRRGSPLDWDDFQPAGWAVDSEV